MHTIDVEELSLLDASGLLNSGSLTSESLVNQYLERIGRLDKNGPCLSSVIELNPDAVSLAQALDKERLMHGSRGPMHGAPILIKDNIDTADRMQTTAGSLALIGNRPVSDAFLVKKLRQAGAIILGKTNLNEWSNGRGLHSVGGWSSRGGLTRNPYALDRSASGSSSGSAAAVAASLCAAAVGTESDGSLLSPAAVCGVVALKPTVGLISRQGIVPISTSMDSPGPMARSVRDCALLLNALVGVDEADEITRISKNASPTCYASSLNIDALKGARLGVARECFDFHPKTDKVYSDVLHTLEKAGAILVDPVFFAFSKQFNESKRTVFLYEMKAGLEAYFQLAQPQCPITSLNDVVAFNDLHGAEVMRWFGQELLIKCQQQGSLNDKAYLNALQVCRQEALVNGIDALTSKYRLDAFIAPTEGPAWKTDFVLGDHFVGGSTTPAAVAGTPSITVPAGQLHGLPLGLSFFSAKWSEKRLFNLAYAFEQLLSARCPPKYLAHVPYDYSS